MTTAATSNYHQINRPPDATYVKWGVDRWESESSAWVELPDASVELAVGNGSASDGAYFVATFSAEALCSSPDANGVVNVTVFFGDEQADPISDNHRFITARGNPEWSSHTLMRTARFEPGMQLRDVTARVKAKVSKGDKMGLQNWLLKIERYDETEDGAIQ